MGCKIGYGRVSSKDQNEDRQIEKFRQAGIEDKRIYIDKKTGKDFARPEYQKMKDYIREGDILYVDSLDRFGRNKAQILQEWEDLTVRMNVDIVVLDMPILDTTVLKDLNGLENLIRDLVLNILSWLAEDERDRIRKRQQEGIEVALSKGKRFGRKPLNRPAQFELYYEAWKAGRITAVKCMEQLSLKRTTFYKLVNGYEAEMSVLKG